MVAGLGMGLAMSSVNVVLLALSPESDQGFNSAALQVSDAQAPDVFAVIDKLDRQPIEVSRERLGQVGLSGAAIERVLGLQRLDSIDGIRSAFPGDVAVGERVAELARYLEFAEALDIREWVDIDLTIVRGLAYYTGIVFELFDAKGEFRAICGGGRYDTLLESLSGTDLPALGFGMGDVVLGEVLKARGRLRSSPTVLDFWVAFEDSKQLSQAMRIATGLRRQGWAVECALRTQSLGKQIDTARKAGADAVIILKTDGSLRKKHLESGEEEPFTFPNG